LSHAAMASWSSVVVFLGLGRRDVADGLQQPAIVEPVHPSQRRELDGFERPPRPAPRLTMKTIARRFSALGGFFTYAKRHGLIDGDNPAHGFEFPRKGRANSKRKMWEEEKLRALFQSPVWTGCHPVYRSQKGPKVIRDDKYWLPLLGLYHSNRLEEFAQLRREDVKKEDRVWYLHIHVRD
jgi:site-specific recombinase XerD